MPRGSAASAGGGRLSVPARASTWPFASTTKMRALVRESACRISSISGTGVAAASFAPPRANSAGRSCSAVATACAVPASVRSCDSRRKRSSSCTYT